MKYQLAKWMRCPNSGERLTLQVKESVDGEVIEGELTSPGGRRYAITRGVPRMLGSEWDVGAEKETAEAFSAKWDRTRNFGHEEKSRSFYVNWYLQRYKFGTIEALGNFLSSKNRILDAGTGVGRDARLYADNTNGMVFGVDLSLVLAKFVNGLQKPP